MSTNLLKPNSILVNNIRTYIKKYKWNGEGIKYPGFTYYPRDPDHKEPPYEATKLFRVQRIKPVRGNPYWEKKILKELHLDGKGGDIAIIKNIPENNARLWKIKHLIQIAPITFPNGMPTEDDLDCTLLKENGELLVNRKLKPTNDVLEASESFEKHAKKLDGNTLRKNSRLKWVQGWDTSL